MGSFVGNQLSPGQLFGNGCILFQKHGPVGIESGSHMLHSAILETRNNYNIIFGKGIINGGVIFQPFQGTIDKGKNITCLSNLQRIALTVPNINLPAIPVVA
ncbi:hypothetical protein SDC9_116496 [bioreactor metagenome]|uniref:Uncharacterized protein n=1 Tax=bioreactor metagenome TaxID=1076179 RepID=A0A645BVU8_9ZZZZ